MIHHVAGSTKKLRRVSADWGALQSARFPATAPSPPDGDPRQDNKHVAVDSGLDDTVSTTRQGPKALCLCELMVVRAPYGEEYQLSQQELGLFSIYS
jgi:hypothetical protein